MNRLKMEHKMKNEKYPLLNARKTTVNDNAIGIVEKPKSHTRSLYWLD